jgi:hypothetical protein
MANYFTLDYENTANTSPSNVELNNGAPTSDGLTVQVSLYAGSGFTPTHYKMWGLELVAGEGIVTISGAEWLPYTETRTARLARNNEPQYAYAKFKNASETETEAFTSNAVTFTFVDPVINQGVTWETDFEDLGFNSATTNSITKSSVGTKVEFNRSKLDQLDFSGRNFTGLLIGDNSIEIKPSSQIGQIIGLDTSNYVSISKTFSSAEVPMISVDYGDGFYTLTAYDQSIRSTVSGTNEGRVSNVVWNSGTKTLTFDAYKFSTYGFCTIQKLEFTDDSQTAAYVGDSAVFRVYVQDTNGEPVESAPVTLSGISGDIGDIQESIPVSTDANGLAEFTLAVDSVGQVVYSASVDSYVVTETILIKGLTPIGAQRSLLTQYEQIYKSATYDDNVTDANTEAVAEPTTPTVSGLADSVIEHDMNVLRTMMKQIKGTTNWFDEQTKYFDPTDTDELDTPNKDLTLANISGNTLDSNTVILAISETNSGAGFSLTPGDEGFLLTTTSDYAKPSNRIGLPIFKSVTNSGTYYDEGGQDRVVEIDVIDASTGVEFFDISGNIIHAKFHDAADHSGTGDGTDVYVKFYTSEGVYTTVSGDPTEVSIVFPYRQVMSDIEEYEWLRTDFVNSWEGDSVILNDVANLWGYTGALNDIADPDWTVISGSPLVDNSIKSLKSALDAINDGFGDHTFTEENYLTSGQSVSDALDALDTSLYDLSSSVSAGTEDKYVVEVASNITAGTAYQLPSGVTYTPDATGGQEGSNLDVYLDGQLLSASTGINGINEDKDYAETDSTHITFHLDIYQYSILTFKVKS